MPYISPRFDSSTKTVFMTKGDFTKWMESLKSGEYKQARSRLRGYVTGGHTGYCCLGVMEHCLTGEVEMADPVFRHQDPTLAASLPSAGWLKDHNIRFFAPDVEDGRVVDARVYLTHADRCDLSEIGNDYFGSEGWVAVSELNDEAVPFEFIAKLLERHVEFTDA